MVNLSSLSLDIRSCCIAFVVVVVVVVVFMFVVLGYTHFVILFFFIPFLA